MTKVNEDTYITSILHKANANPVKPRSYAAFYVDADRELHIYEAADIHKLKKVMDEKHPEYELLHIEWYPESRIARDLAMKSRQVLELRKTLLKMAEVNKPYDYRNAPVNF